MKALALLSFLICPILIQAQGDNESVIKSYLTSIEFGDYEFQKSSTIKMSKDEFDFRTSFRDNYLVFINEYGNSQDMEADFDREDMTDTMIESIYSDMFPELAEMSHVDIDKHAADSGMDAANFKKIVADCERFIKGVTEDPSGNCQLTRWKVKYQKEQVTLFFYINENGEVTEYEEIWPDF